MTNLLCVQMHGDAILNNSFKHHNKCASVLLFFLPYLISELLHASVTFDSKRPYCSPDTANTDIA